MKPRFQAHEELLPAVLHEGTVLTLDQCKWTNVVLDMPGEDFITLTFHDGLSLRFWEEKFYLDFVLPEDAPAGLTSFNGHLFNHDGQVKAIISGEFEIPAAADRKVQEYRFCGDLLTLEEPVPGRAEICAECPANEEGVCLECGCLLSSKMSKPYEKCPIGKWGPVDIEIAAPEATAKPVRKSRK